MTSNSSSDNEPIHVLGLRVTNVLRLKAVEIRPTETGLTVISGRNAQGKSSVLEAVRMALTGGRSIAAKPVRDGAERGEVEVVLGPDQTPLYTVQRVFRGSGTSQLKISAADGTKVSSPQQFLDTLLGRFSFDPLEFADPAGAKTEAEKDKRRVQMLLETVDLGFDLAAHDQARKDAAAERAAINKEVERLKGLLGEAPPAEDEPLEDERDLQERIATARSGAKEAARARKRCEELAQEIDEAEKRLTRMRADLVDEMKRTAAATADPVPMEAELGQIMQRNAKRREARLARVKYDERVESMRATVGRVEDLARQIASMDEKRAAALAAAAFPVKAISIDENGSVTIKTKDGATLPFSQASTAQKLLASFAVMASKAKPFRVALVPNGNDLDAQSMKVLADIAKKFDYQLLVERIVADQPGSIVIEDGSVQEEGAES